MKLLVGVVLTTGGVFDAPVVPMTQQVGTATIDIGGCTAITLSYSFTAGSNAGLV